MSDYRVVAAATMALQNLLLEAIRESVPGATVKTGPPETRPPEEVAEGLINVFLFKTEPNKVWRNEELPFRQADGTLVRKPQLAVDVHYLLSFYGDERRKIPYLLLGLALSALHAEPYPGVRHMPRASGGAEGGGPGAVDPVSTGLAGSGLESQQHPLSFTLLPLHHEELVPLFSQLPYVMSVAYRASVLLIEPLMVPQPPLPVRRAELFVSGMRRPLLASVNPPWLPYSPEAELELRGEALVASFTRVVFESLESVPVPQADGSLVAPLPEGIQAGTHLVRVVQAAEAAEARAFVESNPVALVLEPVVVEAAQVLVPGPTAEPGAGIAPRRPVNLRVKFAPALTAKGPVLLLLNEWLPPGTPRAPRGYAFQTEADPQAPDALAVQVEIEPGIYLVRVQINGVASRLSVDSDPASPTFNRYDGPRVAVQ